MTSSSCRGRFLCCITFTSATKFERDVGREQRRQETRVALAVEGSYSSSPQFHRDHGETVPGLAVGVVCVTARALIRITTRFKIQSVMTLVHCCSHAY